MTIKVESAGIPVEKVAAPEAGEKVSAVKANESEAAAEADETEKSEASEASETEPEESETSQDEGDEEEEPKAEEKPKKKNGFKRRIEKLSKARSEAERERDYWKQEAMKNGQKAQEKPAEAKVEASVEGKPKADSFETHEEYVEALADWKFDQREKAANAKKRETEVKTEFEQKADAFRATAEAFKAKHDDYDDVMESVDDVRLTVGIQQLLLESENGPELAYELSKNRKELERINALPFGAMARAVGRFEASLQSSTVHDTKSEIKTTKAPAPITPVGSKGAAPKKSIFDPNLSQAEYEALRAKQRSA